VKLLLTTAFSANIQSSRFAVCSALPWMYLPLKFHVKNMSVSDMYTKVSYFAMSRWLAGVKCQAYIHGHWQCCLAVEIFVLIVTLCERLWLNVAMKLFCEYWIIVHHYSDWSANHLNLASTVQLAWPVATCQHSLFISHIVSWFAGHWVWRLCEQFWKVSFIVLPFLAMYFFHVCDFGFGTTENNVRSKEKT